MMRDFLSWAFGLGSPDWGGVFLVLGVLSLFAGIMGAIITDNAILILSLPAIAIWLAYREYRRSQGGDK